MQARPPGDLASRIARMQVDGASRGNPGPAGAGVVFFDREGGVVGRAGKFLGQTTNNIAEYEGLLLGLDIAEAAGVRDLHILADSQLLVRQLNGNYRVRNARLQPLHARAMDRLSHLRRYQVDHTYRAGNSQADEMANRAIDERLDGTPEWIA